MNGSLTVPTKRGLALAALIVLAACGTSPSPLPTPEDPDAWPRCAGAAYTVAHPPNWFVHPADEPAGVGECELFAAEPFSDPRREGDWGSSGAQIVLVAGTGCRGSFDVVTTHEDLEIDGHPASQAMLRPGHDVGANLRAYQYSVQLSPAIPCEGSAWFQARTESNDLGSFEENAAILDEMMSTISFEAPGR